MASLLAAAGGAVALQPSGDAAGEVSASGKGVTSEAAAGNIQQARVKASERSDRSSANRSASAGKSASGTVKQAASERKEEAAELAAWEKKQSAEEQKQVKTRSAAAITSSPKQVIKRNIEFTMPVSGYRLSQPFGASGAMWSADHTGQDFAAPSGTEIRALGDGEIVEAQFSGAYGNRTILRLNDGTEIWYCHQTSFKVESGPVKAGDVTGYVGSTGNSTGPHLHIEVRPGGGSPIDPMPWLREHGLNP